MIDLGREIHKKASRKQRGLKLSPGSRFVRGMQPVVVVSTGSPMKYRDLATGQEFEVSRQDFLGVALNRLPLTGVPETDQITRAWDIAGARRIDFRLRTTLLKNIARSMSGDERDMVDSWVKSLEKREEPKKGKVKDNA
tara:strand:+ start:1225 stop:1641 length:417 start_codon:yes stop_codon:yes gene_type:complete